MASYNKFQQFVEDLGNGVHNFTSHALKLALTNTAPEATQETFAPGSSHPPPASANGYTAGGNALANTAYSHATGTATLAADKSVFTADSGQIGPFRYAILYNDTPTSPADPLVAWWDRGASLTLEDTESFEVRFDNEEEAGTIFTLA